MKMINFNFRFLVMLLFGIITTTPFLTSANSDLMYKDINIKQKVEGDYTKVILQQFNQGQIPSDQDLANSVGLYDTYVVSKGKLSAFKDFGSFNYMQNRDPENSYAIVPLIALHWDYVEANPYFWVFLDNITAHFRYSRLIVDWDETGPLVTDAAYLPMFDSTLSKTSSDYRYEDSWANWRENQYEENKYFVKKCADQNLCRYVLAVLKYRGVDYNFGDIFILFGKKISPCSWIPVNFLPVSSTECPRLGSQ